METLSTMRQVATSKILKMKLKRTKKDAKIVLRMFN